MMARRKFKTGYRGQGTGYSRGHNLENRQQI